MPAPPPIDRNNPSFLRYPIQGARTGFKPVSLPLILVVPWRRNENGTTLGDTNVFDVKYYIVEPPDQAKVAGPFNTGLLIPQTNKFTININNLQLNDVLIQPKNHVFHNSTNIIVQPEDAQEGDTFDYTLIRGNITSTIPYYPDADYYDLSNFIMDVEDLPRPKQYLFVWQASYYKRTERELSLSSTLGAVCISNETAITQFKILINHPGDVHQEMFKKTPPLYFENISNNATKLSNDKTLEFYRPFADLLQDIFDEQSFLNGINHIDKIPAQLIPYLAYIIGWDLPNFPGVTDQIRRSVLRRAVRLQRLKGSKRAIIELFDIFGYTINIINLWYSIDGSRFIAPGEKLPTTIQDQKILTETKCQIDPIIINYNTAGFGKINAPLIQRANGPITITAYLVKSGPTKDELLNVVNDLNDNPTILESTCYITSGGNVVPQALTDRLPINDNTVVAISEVFVDFHTGVGINTASTSSVPVINNLGIKYDNEKNIIYINFDHHIDFNDETTLFIFATYQYNKITVPEQLENLRSNRFDVRILFRDGTIPEPQLFEFLMNFVFKLKAFHSLLRKIIFRIDFIQAYNVQDLCFGSGSQLQVPPPIIPSEAECTKTNNLKPEDIALRDAIFNSVLEDFIAWKALDDTHDSDEELEKLLNVPVNEKSGTQCQYTEYGQDRVESTPNTDLDHNVDQRATVCDERPPLPDNCFKGRVRGDIDVVPRLILSEIYRNRPCVLGVGNGSYWLFPTTEFTNQRDGFGSYKGQVDYSHLGRKIRQYGKPIPQSLHYTDRPFLINGQLNGNRLLGYQKPSLEIDKDNFGFPSHRFISMRNLKDDFTHPTWTARPWDDNVDLNATIVIGTDDDEYIVYDNAPLVYKGNGFNPDISSFGEHEDRDFLVTHKIYIVQDAGHPAISFDDTIVTTQEQSITLDSNQPFGPIFRSYNKDCNQDFRSGYPAVTGRFDVPENIGFSDGDTESEQIADILGLPDAGSSFSTALFTFGSQILLLESDYEYQYYKPYRLDCDCSRFACDTGTGTQVSELTLTGCDVRVNVSQCHLDFFRMPDGTYDFNCDKLEMNGKIILSELIGTCSNRLNGVIENMLCINSVSDSILPEGSVYYKDDYGVIYDINWVINNDVLDLLTITKDPRVWGEPDSGYVSNRRVFRRGIITSIRQLIRIKEDGYDIIGEGKSQKIDFFQTNVLCNDKKFVDNFCFHLDCQVLDEIESNVLCGSRWTICDDQVQWPYLLTDSSGVVNDISVPANIQPFQWINVWSGDTDDITGVCPATDEGTEEYVEMTFVGTGGLIPAYDDGSGQWPTVLPFYPFESIIDVTLNRRIIELVSVTFYGFKHTFSGDLHAVLLPPPCAECPGVTIFHRPGSASASFGNYGDFNGNYTFVENGYSILPAFGDITPNTYRRSPGDWPGGILPLGSFDDLINVRTQGKWRLLIFDWELGDSGVLDSWAITCRVACESPTDVVNRRQVFNPC